MVEINYIELYKKIEELISSCYEKYKDKFSVEEQDRCEMYLYTQGEYEEALGEILAILKKHNIEMEDGCYKSINAAKKLMKID